MHKSETLTSFKPRKITMYVTHSHQSSVTYNKWMAGDTYFAEYDWTCRNQVGYLYGSVCNKIKIQITIQVIL
jgi:hypothetical protein